MQGRSLSDCLWHVSLAASGIGLLGFLDLFLLAGLGAGCIDGSVVDLKVSCCSATQKLIPIACPVLF